MALTLTTFVAGTKAKAEEVNANFSAIQTALAEKASIDGDATQTFSIADATKNEHAVTKSQLETASENSIAEAKKAGAKFCAKSGNKINGAGALFSYSVLKLTPLIAGTYANLVISDYLGKQTTISTTPDTLDLTGNSDGTYNIFITSAGKLYILNNKIYKQPKRPTMVVNDVWLDNSSEPFNCIKYTGSSDETFSDVPLGTVTITSSAITSVTTSVFNQDNYVVNSQSSISLGTNLSASIPNCVMPNYKSGVSKSFSTVYKADTDGVLYVYGSYNVKIFISSGNADTDSTNYTWTTFSLGNYGDQAYGTGGFVPIPKGMYYKATAGSGNTLTFYPSLGA